MAFRMSSTDPYEIGLELGARDAEEGVEYDESNYGLGESIGRAPTKRDRAKYRKGYREGFKGVETGGDDESSILTPTNIIIFIGILAVGAWIFKAPSAAAAQPTTTTK